MAIYDMQCHACGWQGEVSCKIAERDNQMCVCGEPLDRQLSAPHGRVDTPADGSKPAHRPGGDQFTADAMGISKKDLMTEPCFSGLREKGPGAI